jgi:hypothetical protein
MPLEREGRDDVGAAARERLDQRPRDALEVGVAVGDRTEGDVEAAAEFGTELGLVEVAGGLGVQVQMPGIQRPPAAVIGRVGEVGDQHVGVQQRIIRPGGPVPEPGGHEPVRRHLLVAALAAAGVGGVPFQVVQSRDHGGVVGLTDLPGDVRIGQRPQQRHRLRGPEGQIEPGHGAGVTHQRLPVGRVRAGQHRAQRLGGHQPVQTEPGGGGAEPAAGRFAGAGVAGLDRGRDGGQVVLGAAVSELADVQHRPPPPPPTSRRSAGGSPAGSAGGSAGSGRGGSHRGASLCRGL